MRIKTEIIKICNKKLILHNKFQKILTVISTVIMGKVRGFKLVPRQTNIWIFTEQSKEQTLLRFIRLFFGNLIKQNE